MISLRENTAMIDREWKMIIDHLKLSVTESFHNYHEDELEKIHHNSDVWTNIPIMSPRDMIVISNLCKKYAPGKNNIVMEVGTANGGSAMLMSFSTQAKIIGFDIFTQYNDTAGVSSFNRNNAESTATNHGFADRFSLFTGDVEAMNLRIKDSSIDLVFIDACHLYEHVKKDIAYCWPKIRPGGVLCGHDYCGNHPGVMQAVNDWSEGFRVNVGFGSSVFYAEKDQ